VRGKMDQVSGAGCIPTDGVPCDSRARWMGRGAVKHRLARHGQPSSPPLTAYEIR